MSILDESIVRLEPEWWVKRDKNGNPLPPVVGTAAYVESIDKAVAAKLVRADEMRKALYGGAAPEPEPSCEPKCECKCHVAVPRDAEMSVLREGRRINVCGNCYLSDDTEREMFAQPQPGPTEPPATWSDAMHTHPAEPSECYAQVQGWDITATVVPGVFDIMVRGELVLRYDTREHAHPTDAFIAEVKRLRCLLAQRPEPDTRAQVVCDSGWDD